MYYFGRTLLPVIALVVGIGLIFNCLKAIFRREDSWDSESTNQNLLANTVGVLIGVALLAGVYWYYSYGISMLIY